MKDIEQYLRENKPVVKDNPTFILETRRRMEAVEGIKGEVDRQRCTGRTALVIALAAGLAAGVIITVLAFLFPANASSLGEGLWASLRLFLDSYKYYMFVVIAVLSIALGLILPAHKEQAQWIK